jgi:uncharacterized repeat protein (TIGR02543 family)
MIARIVVARVSAWLPVLCASVLFLACGPAEEGAELQGGESSATACATCGLTVSNVSQGGGAGTVTSKGNQINCGSACFYRYPSGTVVTLTAKAASSSSRFVAWGAPCNNGAATCAVTMNKDRTVTATFAAVGATYPLTVTRSGSGAGTVKSTPAGIDCGATCTARWAKDTRVTLTATATSPSVFAGWSGPCTGTSAICVVSLTQATSVGAAFTGGSELPLLVTVTGTGNGLVYDDTTGISCPGTCSTLLPAGTAVTLTAHASDGSTFAGWSGACQGAATTCAVTAAPGLQVGASFALASTSYLLEVSPVGERLDARVTLSTASDSRTCAMDVPTCLGTYPVGTVVTATVEVPSGKVFAGWTGDCTGTTPACTLVMNKDQTTTFHLAAAATYTLDVSSGGGEVYVYYWWRADDVTMGMPANGYYTCGPDVASCTLSFPLGTGLKLTTTAPSGKVFAAWTGDCIPKDVSTCNLTMYGNHTAGATFQDPSPGTTRTLTVHLGTGFSGRITSSPAGIDCGTTCTATFPVWTQVTLTDTSRSEIPLTVWNYDCGGYKESCVLSMDEDRMTVAEGSVYRLGVKPQGAQLGALVTLTDASGSNICLSDQPDCGNIYPIGTVVTVTVEPPSGQVVSGWTGDCSGTSPTCTLVMNKSRTTTFLLGPAAPTSSCKVTYALNSEWPGGFNAGLVIQNTGTTAWNGWTLSWTFPTTSQKVTQLWNGTYAQAGSTVTVNSLGTNGTVPAGGSYSSLGFLGSWSGSNPAPTAFSVNGSPCH